MTRAWPLIVALAIACGDNGSADLPCAAPCGTFACDGTTGRCFDTCETALECADGRRCERAVCVGSECTDATAELCAPYGCVLGTCASDCVAAPCADGYYCRGDTNACVPRCTRASDPACGGHACDVGSGECEPYCADGEQPCAAGHRCTADHRCVVDETAATCAAGCGLYACLEPLGRCATHCLEAADCAAGATCDAGNCR